MRFLLRYTRILLISLIFQNMCYLDQQLEVLFMNAMMHQPPASFYSFHHTFLGLTKDAGGLVRESVVIEVGLLISHLQCAASSILNAGY